MATIHSAHDGPTPSSQKHSAKTRIRELQLAVCDEPEVDLESESLTQKVEGEAPAVPRAEEKHGSVGASPSRTLTSSATGAAQPTDIAAATAAILDLNMQVARTDGLEAAGRVVVERLVQHLKLDRVAFAWRRPTGACSLIAVSGLTRFDRRSELVELLHSAANEAVARQSDGSWPPLLAANRHSLIAHRKLVEVSHVEATASYRLTESSKQSWGQESRSLGVLLVTGSRAAVHDPANVRFLTTAAKCLSATLELTARAEGGFVRRSMTRFRRSVSRRSAALMTMFAIGVVALMATPWPYRISCRCVVEPMQRRFVVAPHDGLIETSLVQPGDVVHAGQPLARMDAREVRWELAGLEADRRQAMQQRDTSLTRGELAKSELARLEIEQLDAKLELLRRRASLLELQAPLDGVVLSGSLDKLSSAPVKTGQVLFEIAPLDRLRVEVATPAEDYRYVKDGASVELRFEGRLNELQTGTLARVRPRSEIRDSADVFVAEVELENPEGSLRPGQRGSAIIISSSHPLAWNLFHKAADRVRQWLPF